MIDDKSYEPTHTPNQEDPIKNTNRWIFIALNVLSLLLWISVFTNWLFHFPAPGKTGSLIIMAFVISGLSTLYREGKCQGNNP